MAWTSPMTFIPNTVLTAAQLNTHLRDNLLELGPAKATGADTTGYFVVDSPHQISRRIITSHVMSAARSTNSSAWTDLDQAFDQGAGPTIKVYTGTKALLMIESRVKKQVDAPHKDTAFVGVEIFGATEREPEDRYALKFSQYKDTAVCGMFAYVAENLTPGMNFFRLKYKVQGESTATFSFSRILILPL